MRFFFLLIASPPSPPLFPYTTLFRSLRRPRITPDVAGSAFQLTLPLTGNRPGWSVRARLLDDGGEVRSEEHTSELQSRGHLVCRLLLEKEKKKGKQNSHHNRTLMHDG